MSGSCLRITILETVFYYFFYYREIMGSWSESISWGSCCGAAVCKSNGESGLFFCLVCFFNSLQQLFALLLEGGSAWILSCLVLPFAALTTREPCVTGYSRLGKTNVFDLVSLFCCEASWSGWEEL